MAGVRGILLKIGVGLFLGTGVFLLFWPWEIDEESDGPNHAQHTPDPAWLAQAAGVETEAIAYRQLASELRTIGKLDYNESRVAYITARIAGRVDRLYADFTGVPVKKKEHLVDIYSPDLYVAQTELIRALERLAESRGRQTPLESDFAQSNLEAARTKLSLLGILPEQIEEIEHSKKVKTHLTIYAPLGGTVIEKNVRLGQYVKEGDPLYRIAELDPIWLYLDLYEYDVGLIRYGQKVEVTVEAYPGATFKGSVVFKDPFLDDRTRTVKVRVVLPNGEKKLQPAMYASATILVRLRGDGTPAETGLEGKYFCPMHPEVVQKDPGECPRCGMKLELVPKAPPPAKDPHKGHQKKGDEPKGHEHMGHEHEGHEPDALAPKPGPALAIPVSAVLDTGRRKIAYRQNKDGSFEIVDLQVGPRAEGKDAKGKKVSYYPVLAGLKAGDRVVVRGGFLLDSQRQIEGLPSLLYPEGRSAAHLHSAHGGPTPPAKAPTPPAHKH